MLLAIFEVQIAFDLFTASGSDLETTRVGHRVMGSADNGVLPVSVTLGQSDQI